MRARLAALAMLGAAACASGPDLTPASGVPVDAKIVTYKDHIFTAGDHVRIKSTAGTFKPKDTGHSIDIRGEAGRTGIVLGGMKRGDPATPGEPVQILLIRFDTQVWRDTSSSGAEVTIPSFEASIHADYVEAVPAK